MIGRATVKLPFPEVMKTTDWWSMDTYHEKQHRENWKRFKRLCQLLARDGLQYCVAFHFETIKADRWQDTDTDGVRAEIQWRVP